MTVKVTVVETLEVSEDRNVVAEVTFKTSSLLDLTTEEQAEALLQISMMVSKTAELPFQRALYLKNQDTLRQDEISQALQSMEGQQFKVPQSD